MNMPPEVPPLIVPHRMITYQLTRWDLFANWFTIFLRSRILQVFLIAIMILNAGLILGPGLRTRPVSHTVFEGVIYLIGLVGVLIVFQGMLGFANAFLLKQRGLVGQHVLEITEQGLVERTEFNETLHKWSSICRILSIWGYLFIYVSDNNSHQVPKRGFSSQEISEFEKDLRAHAQRTGSRDTMSTPQNNG